jgi:hypothetical protein
MSRGALEDMLQMSAVQSKALLNAACKVVDNACTFLLGKFEVLNENALNRRQIDHKLLAPASQRCGRTAAD